MNTVHQNGPILYVVVYEVDALFKILFDVGVLVVLEEYLLVAVDQPLVQVVQPRVIYLVVFVC